MSDQDEFWKSPDPHQGEVESPSPPSQELPPPEPIKGHDVASDNVAAGRVRSRRWVVGVASFAAVSVLIGTLFLVTRASSDKGGASSAEDAAAALFTAVENEDFLALAELLHPGERRTLAEPAIEIVDELVRVGILDPQIDLGSIGGVDITIESLEYHLEPVAGTDDLKELIVDAGTINSSATGDELPLGPALKDRFADQLSELTSSSSDSMTDTSDGAKGLIIVEHEGRWYFSLWYSIAEDVRRKAGVEAVPSLEALPAVIGADSPDEAVTAAIQSMVDLDLTGTIGMLDPEEAAVLYRYSPLFLDDAEQAIDELLAQAVASNIVWNISDIKTESETDGDVAYVKVKTFRASASADDMAVDISYSQTEVSVEVVYQGAHYNATIQVNGKTLTFEGSIDGAHFEGEATVTDNSIHASALLGGSSFEGSIAWDPKGICSDYEFIIDGEATSGCLEEVVPNIDSNFAASYINGLEELDSLEFPTLTLVATKTDGKWFFSPLLSVSNSILESLRNVDPEIISDRLDMLEKSSQPDY